MNGLELTKKTSELFPTIIIMLMSGYPDLEDLANAINDCGISYYINKPWQVAQIKIIFESATKEIRLRRENQALLLEMEKKKSEIETLNTTLEASFIESIRLLSDIMAEAAPELSKHSKKVAILAKKVHSRLACDGSETDLEIACLLHDIGLIGLPAKIYLSSSRWLSGELRTMFNQHSKLGAEMLKSAPQLEHVRESIYQHHENIDGSGLLGLEGDILGMNTKILRICDFYDEAVNLRKEKHQQTIEFMKRREGVWFDSEALKNFLAIITELEGPVIVPTPLLSITSGMKIGKDVVSKNGHLVLSEGAVITELNIKRLRIYNESDPIEEIYTLKE